MKRTSLLQRLREMNPEVAEKELYARIVCGEILVDGATVRIARQPVFPAALIEYRPRRRFVSRGGDKLDGVLARWDVEVAGLSLIDAGSSSGGFTDCLLQRGARAVIAVEKGFNQLDFRLRRDPRVAVLEKTSIMELSAERLPFPAQAAVADLSLRSLRTAAAHILSLLAHGWLIALVKPQYERVGGPLGSGITLLDREEVLDTLGKLVLDLSNEGLRVIRAAPSPIPGTKGNREFFFEIVGNSDAPRQTPGTSEVLCSLEQLVAEAFPG